jgi:electron transport complex protein RnfD
VVTFAIRYWGSYTEGVSFALLFMNLWVPFINEWTRQTPYGYIKPKKAAKEGAAK